MPSFLVLRLRRICAGSHPNRGFKKDTLAAKNGRVLLKNILFKLNLQDERQLDSSFLIYILYLSRMPSFSVRKSCHTYDYLVEW